MVPGGVTLLPEKGEDAGRVQAVGARVTHQYDRPWRTTEAREGQLVVIGLKGLDRVAVAHALVG